MRLCLLLFTVFLVCAAAQDAGDARQRARMARDLGRQEASSAIPKLRPLLRDPALEVRLEAVKSMVAVGGLDSLAPLIEATRDNDPEMQIRATDGLVNFYSPGYIEVGLSAQMKRAGTAIRARFTDVNDRVIDPYVQVRPEVISALGALARGGSSMDSRANAARAIGILRGKDAVGDLVTALRSKDDQVMYEALIALQKIRDNSAGPKILFVLNDLNERVQIAAIETAGLLHTKEAVPELASVLQRTDSRKVRRAAIGSLALIADPASRAIFDQYLRDADDGMRAGAAEGIGRLKNPADRAALEALFKDERKMNARLSQAFALVHLGRTELTEFSPLQYLVNTLNSRSFRGVAQPFLTELTRDPGIRRTVETALARGTRDEKIGILTVLSVSGDQQSLATMEPFTRDPDENVAQEAIRAVRSLKARLG
jgi:HEAT repeat protein